MAETGRHVSLVTFRQLSEEKGAVLSIRVHEKNRRRHPPGIRRRREPDRRLLGPYATSIAPCKGEPPACLITCVAAMSRGEYQRESCCPDIRRGRTPVDTPTNAPPEPGPSHTGMLPCAPTRALPPPTPNHTDTTETQNRRTTRETPTPQFKPKAHGQARCTPQPEEHL